MPRPATSVLVLFTLVAPATVTGCRFRERVCFVGEYPARAIQYPKTGGVCVKDGHRPPAGYETYPAGQTPTYVDQQRH